MLLDSLLAGTMLFSSFALRTSNVQPNPDDYETSIGISNNYFYINRQWERELGTKYIDDLIWLKLDNGFYFKPEYMNKQSKSVKYLKLDWRRSIKGVSIGATTRSVNDKLDHYQTFASVGYLHKKTYDEKVDIEFSLDGYAPPDSDIEYENKFKVSWKLTKKVRLYNIGQFSKLQGNQFYKAKIGIEYSL